MKTRILGTSVMIVLIAGAGVITSISIAKDNLSDLGEATSSQPIWYVDDDAPNDPGPNNPGVSDPNEDGSLIHPFDEIQEGINVAANTDTVYVYKGNYIENIIVDKSINLIGEDKDTTIIDGDINDDVVYVSADEVTITGFKIINSGSISDYDAGIEIRADHCSISANNVGPSNRNGIILFQANDNDITDNTITSNTHNGIKVEKSNSNTINQNYIAFDHKNHGVFLFESIKNNIEDNVITNNQKARGISLWYSDENTIADNMISDNEAGIFYDYSNYNTIISNTITSNTKFGIKFYHYNHPSENDIIDNVITFNEIGMRIWQSNDNYIVDNIINDNIIGIEFQSADNNQILCNNIMDNGELGLKLDSSDNNVIAYNQFGKQGTWYSGQNDYWTVWIYFFNTNSNDNKFYYNNFDYPAGDDTNGNQWDDDLSPGKGNYWSWESGVDYDGNDVLDMIHNLYGDGGAKDRYPTVKLNVGPNCLRKLDIEKVDNNPIYPFTTYTYTITVSNPLSYTVHDVYVVDFLPPGTLDVPTGTTPDIISRVNRGQHQCVITWYFASLNPSGTSGSSVTMTVEVEVDTSSQYIPPTSGNLHNDVFVYSDETITAMTYEDTLYGTKSGLKCSGSLIWSDVKPGSTITGSFLVMNDGDVDSNLNWDITEYPSWGTWTITPSNGTNLKPEDEPVEVFAEVEVPDEKNADFSGEVKIVNRDDPSDYEIIPVSLTTPKNKSLTEFNPWILRLIQRFPILELLL